MPFVVSSARALARVLGESTAQLYAKPAMRDVIGQKFLLQGVVEEPLAAYWLTTVLPGESLAKHLLDWL